MGDNLPSPVGIGLTDLPKMGGGSGPPGPSSSGITELNEFELHQCPSLQSILLKVALFRKCDVFFRSPNLGKRNIPKNYSELEI